MLTKNLVSIYINSNKLKNNDKIYFVSTNITTVLKYTSHQKIIEQNVWS